MNYVIVTEVRGGKYWLDKYGQLNGLIQNAKIFYNSEIAASVLYGNRHLFSSELKFKIEEIETGSTA